MKKHSQQKLKNVFKKKLLRFLKALFETNLFAKSLQSF